MRRVINETQTDVVFMSNIAIKGIEDGSKVEADFNIGADFMPAIAVRSGGLLEGRGLFLEDLPNGYKWEIVTDDDDVQVLTIVNETN